MEVELKYSLPSESDLRRLAEADHLGVYALRPLANVHVHDEYLDTAGNRLQQAGYALRVRHNGQPGVEITLKGLDSSHTALHKRKEANIRLAEMQTPSEWPAGRARKRVMHLVGDDTLVPQVSLEQARVTRAVEVDGRLVALLSLDVVTYSALSQSTQEYEVELELQDGSETELQHLGQILAVEYPVVSQPQSKFARAVAFARQPPATAGRPSLAEGSTAAPDTGAQAVLPNEVQAPAAAGAVSAGSSPDEALPQPAALVDEAPPRAAVASTVVLQPEQTMAEAGGAMLALQLARLREQEEGVHAGKDAEAVHKMRVATRRIRAVLGICSPYYKRKSLEPWADDLRHLTRALGSVRDLDVQIDLASTFAATLEGAAGAGLEGLVAELRRRRKPALKQLRADLSGRPYHHILEGLQKLAKCSECHARRLDAGEPSTLAEVLPSALWQAYGRMRSHTRNISQDAPMTALHALRLAVKPLRYILEFSESLLGSDGESLIQATVAMQEALGALCDTDVTLRLLKDYLAEQGQTSEEVPPSFEGIRRYTDRCTTQLIQGRVDFLALWHQVNAPEYRRALAAAVARL